VLVMRCHPRFGDLEHVFGIVMITTIWALM
jgi:hypothetical protein